MSPRAMPISAWCANGAEVRVRLERKRAQSGCLPSCDPMLASVGSVYGRDGVGVLLSGMGRDGAIGARQLVEEGGAILAQDRHSAAIWGMPRAVAEAGLACAVLPPAELARRVGQRAEASVVEVSEASRRILASLLEAKTGQQLAMNRRWRIETALAAIMRERGYDSVDQLVSRLVARADPSLQDAVIEALLNNETYFFRDKLPFDLLMAGPVKRLERARAARKKLSIWCAGCSSGQEAYSLAMSFADEKLRWAGWQIEIVGTDLSKAAIGRAKAGTYSQFEVQRGLPVMQMIRHFEELGGGDWRISDVLRRQVRFEARNITERAARARQVRHHPLPQPPALFLAGDAAARLQPPRRGDRPGRRADARRRRDGARPDRPLRLRRRMPRPLHAGLAGSGRRSLSGLTSRRFRAVRAAWTGSSRLHRPIRTSARSRSRSSCSIIPAWRTPPRRSRGCAIPRRGSPPIM